MVNKERGPLFGPFQIPRRFCKKIDPIHAEAGSFLPVEAHSTLEASEVLQNPNRCRPERVAFNQPRYLTVEHTCLSIIMAIFTLLGLFGLSSRQTDHFRLVLQIHVEHGPQPKRAHNPRRTNTHWTVLVPSDWPGSHDERLVGWPETVSPIHVHQGREGNTE
jgi:hypothetical protein